MAPFSFLEGYSEGYRNKLHGVVFCEDMMETRFHERIESAQGKCSSDTAIQTELVL